MQNARHQADRRHASITSIHWVRLVAVKFVKHIVGQHEQHGISLSICMGAASQGNITVNKAQHSTTHDQHSKS
jgi:hypothetical protein